MNLKLSLLSVVVVISSVSSLGFAKTSKNVIEENKKIVRDFYDLAFNKHKPTEAAKKYIGDKYIQHNPLVPNGAAAFYNYFEEHFKKNPQSKAIIHRVIGDGDLVK